MFAAHAAESPSSAANVLALQLQLIQNCGYQMLQLPFLLPCPCAVSWGDNKASAGLLYGSHFLQALRSMISPAGCMIKARLMLFSVWLFHSLYELNHLLMHLAGFRCWMR